MAVGYQLLNIVVSLDNLLLDANNYRLDYEGEDKEYSDIEIEDPVTQEGLMTKLVREKLAELKESINENGFLEVDRLVVRQSESNSNKYIVVEGNRRTAAFKSLIADHKSPKNATSLDSKLIEKSYSINVVQIVGDRKDIEEYAATLMGIRHVSGPKKWRGIQAARLISKLQKEGKSATQIGALLGISPQDSNRRYRGYLAYEQMRKEKQFKEKVKTNHYTLLLEFLPIRNNIGQEWLGWNSSTGEFENIDNRDRLYKALTVKDSNGRCEINNPDDARRFLKAIGNIQLRSQIEEGIRLEKLVPANDIITVFKEFERYKRHKN